MACIPPGIGLHAWRYLEVEWWHTGCIRQGYNPVGNLQARIWILLGGSARGCWGAQVVLAPSLRRNSSPCPQYSSEHCPLGLGVQKVAWTFCLEVPGGTVVADLVHKPGIWSCWKPAGQDMDSSGWQYWRVQRAAWPVYLQALDSMPGGTWR